jgi:RNA polymerase sigma-70 factor (ECF subfamily)
MTKEPSSFGPTHWTHLEQEREAGHGDQWFCENYRCPIFAWFRDRFPHHEAEDLCQEFLCRQVIVGRLVDKADRQRGSLRAFLRTAMQRFVLNTRRNRRTIRTGGSAEHVPLLDNDLPASGAAPAAPDEIFDRLWAQELLQRAFLRTEQYCLRRDRGHIFEALLPILDGSGPARSHSEIASELGKSVAYVASALHNIRKRLRMYLLEEIQLTVADHESAAAEWEVLEKSLRR